MIAIASLLIVVSVSLLVTRAATVVLVATGLSRQEARFQARSALSGTGFTTREAESVVSHPTRRRVVMMLMLLGNAGLVAAASTLILGFKNGTPGQLSLRVVELIGGMLVLVLVSRSRVADRWLTDVIGRVVNRHTDLVRRDLSGLLQLSGDYSVAELAVTEDDWMAGHQLSQLALRDEGVVVLGVTRSDGQYIGAPTGATAVLAGDVLIVYGRSSSLAELDHRQRGSTGDRRHEEAARDQDVLEVDQHARDLSSAQHRT